MPISSGWASAQARTSDSTKVPALVHHPHSRIADVTSHLCWSCTLRDLANLPKHCPIAHPAVMAISSGWASAQARMRGSTKGAGAGMSAIFKNCRRHQPFMTRLYARGHRDRHARWFHTLIHSFH